MEQCATKCLPVRPTIQTIFAAELFAKLPQQTQDAIIDLIKSLLSDE